MTHLKIGLLNLMTDKKQTNSNFEQVLNQNNNVDLTYYYSASRYSEPPEPNMKPLKLEELKYLDGFIISGSPVERISDDKITYLPEVHDLLNYLHKSDIIQLYVCWGAMEALAHLYGIRKKPLSKKDFGVYQNRIVQSDPLLKDIPTGYLAPNARYTEMDLSQVNEDERLEVLSVTENNLLSLAKSNIANQTFLFNHLEYHKDDLDKEYQLEIASGKVPNAFKAHNYYKNNQPTFEWQESQEKFFNNWLNTFKRGN
ncbi:homoserine O-acetyltransferase/O-succinyltransferase family protein [Lactobacillus terrae]|uniref:homoserine O-acetyltransferase/O-succinyltransferase family protein n=1 Tax=Lactobacillus terrae TaxID=2269374 RepID=UPI000C1B764D|nr:homoserine O-succinyltransferase [Lactobacillus terrae]